MKNLKGTFDNLVETLKRWDLYQIGDEVDMDLNELSNIIDEVEKRMQCVTNTNKDIRTLVSKYEDVILYYSNNDFELLERSVNDIDIAIDLNDAEPIENNWYSLFKDKFKPRSVAEYVATLPKEEPKVLIPKGTILEWKATMNSYNVKGGAKARVTKDWTINDESEDNTIDIEFIDELRNGQEQGGYFRWMFNEEFVEVAPTELCKTPQTHEFVKDIIAKLKVIDVDGETMQYILEQVGMDGQMLYQLIKSCEHLEQVEEIIDEAKTLNKTTRGCIEI
jgi:hypothetical protein